MVVGRRCEGQLVVLEEGEASDLDTGLERPGCCIIHPTRRKLQIHAWR